MADPVLIVGTGAQAKYALETLHLRSVPVMGLLAIDAAGAPESLDGATVLGTLDDFEQVLASHPNLQLLLACSSNSMKFDLQRRFETHRPRYAQAIHPGSFIARTATLGEGVIVNAAAVIQPFATVGRHVMIHAGAVIEHDARIGDFANIAPRACLTGHVIVGEGATIFAGAVVTPSVHIGAWAVVGAGAVVLDAVESDTTVAGVPARALARKAKGTDGQ